MKASVFLAERAVVRDGGLWDFYGVGWHISNPQFSGCVVGVVVEVPWEETSEEDRVIEVSVTGRMLGGGELTDTPQQLRLSKTFKAWAGTRMVGAPVRGVLGCPIPPASLQLNSRYTVQVTIDGASDDGWSADFYTWGDKRPE